MIKNNLVGGPIIVFHRHHNSGETRLRQQSLGDESLPCHQVLGVDANALYLWCLMQKMPTGYPNRYRSEEHFVPTSSKKQSKVAHGWLEYVAWKERIEMRHAYKGGEMRVGRHALPVDGYCSRTKTIYQFHGCVWHGHPCHKTQGYTHHPYKPEKTMSDLHKDTKAKEEYFKSLGYNLIVMRECEWERTVDSNLEIKAFLHIFFKNMYPPTESMDLAVIVRRIQSGEFFGFVECDISVPENLRDKFSEMSPVFKNVQVSRKELSPHMLRFAEKSGYLKAPQRMLIGSMFGEKILLLSELAKWYLEQGLEITKVYQLVEYRPRCAFAPFGESVSDARRRGDQDPDLELLATTSKLVGNSAYGKTITNKERHRQVTYVDGIEEASARIRSVKFTSMDEIDEDFFEMTSHKPTVRTSY